jgi:hypothetical protein
VIWWGALERPIGYKPTTAAPPSDDQSNKSKLTKFVTRKKEAQFLTKMGKFWVYLYMTTTAIIELAPFDEKAARAEIQIAWENHKRNGMEFGRVCYEWTARVAKSKGGHGSAGQGLSEILRVLGIDRYVFDYWVKKYECSIGQGIPCPYCTQTFPSKSKLKQHKYKAHGAPVSKPEPVKPIAPKPVQAPIVHSSDPETWVKNPTLEVTAEEKDREQLVFLVKRLDSLSKALQQVADDNAKWSKFEEYKEVISLGKKIVGLVALLGTDSGSEIVPDVKKVRKARKAEWKVQLDAIAREGEERDCDCTKEHCCKDITYWRPTGCPCEEFDPTCCHAEGQV